MNKTPPPDHRPRKADALLLSCMDYRFVNAVHAYMDGRGLRGKYNHLALAGASLGAVAEEKQAWRQSFWEHLELSLKLHGVHTVILLDHRDCGAYRILLGDDHARDSDTEKHTHAGFLRELKAQIIAAHPELKVETLLMDLDGTVEEIDA